MERRDLSGQTLDGRYRVLAPVGKGAMGSVYRAEDVKLGRTVAVKVMNEHVPSAMGSRRRFDREARAMAKLEHPHCAQIVDVGMHDDQPFVVMEFITGQSLDELVAAGPMPVERAVAITRQILAGLAHAHEHGIVHRDIKPANIALGQRSGLGDQIKILDFGLAKIDQETSNLTAGVIVGTPSYMAPEQIRGLALDPRVDVYACGVLLFELLTGKKPFRPPVNDPLAICMMHLNDPPPRLADGLPGHDFGALEDVLATALEKDRDRRFSTATAFSNALATALEPNVNASAGLTTPMPKSESTVALGPTVSLADIQHQPPTAHLTGGDLLPVPAPPPIPRRSSGMRWLFVAGGAVVVAIVVIAIAVVGSGGDGQPAKGSGSVASGSARESIAESGSSGPSNGSGSGSSVVVEPEIEPDDRKPPEPVAAILARADELLAKRMRDAALDVLVKARRKHPNDARLPYRAGILYMDKLFWPDGLKQLRAAIKLDGQYRSDGPLIEAALRAFNALAYREWQLAGFLHDEIGAPAKPYLEEAAKNHKNPVVRARASAELTRFR